MKVALTGASGFIGQRLMARLLLDGHSIHAVGRRRPSGSPSIDFSQWDSQQSFPADALQVSDAIIHLAGEPVGQRWNSEIKEKIRNSRINGTRAVVATMSNLSRPPQTLICASAIGYYGNRGDEVLDESSHPGTGYLADVCVEWEREALAARSLGVRVVLLRIGIVLGQGGGALKQMLPPFKLGVGGPTGSGWQWMSWIHVDDIAGAIAFALTNQALSGPVNGTAPNPVRNEEFTRALGRALGRPALIPTPVFALKMMLGEAAQMVLASQRVLPAVLNKAGYNFQYANLDDALRNVVGRT
jgi:uncharacterized protein (TIGR01777 family)